MKDAAGYRERKCNMRERSTREGDSHVNMQRQQTFIGANANADMEKIPEPQSESKHMMHPPGSRCMREICRLGDHLRSRHSLDVVVPKTIHSENGHGTKYRASTFQQVVPQSLVAVPKSSMKSKFPLKCLFALTCTRGSGGKAVEGTVVDLLS